MFWKSQSNGYDVVCCSLFLHHLNDAQAITVLGKMREAAGTLALVNDLARNRPGYWRHTSAHAC